MPDERFAFTSTVDGFLLAGYRWLIASDTQHYEGGRHEMLNETNRYEVTANIIAWLDGLPAISHRQSVGGSTQ